jgi:hypothetical protein
VWIFTRRTAFSNTQLKIVQSAPVFVLSAPISGLLSEESPRTVPHAV